MKAVHSLLTLSFLPKSQDFGLLLLRVGLGTGMQLLHGYGKLTLVLGIRDWANQKTRPAELKTLAQNVDVFNLAKHFPTWESSGYWCLYALLFAEVTCSLLLIVGLFSRFASFILALAMGVALYTKHKTLGFSWSGELAALYCLGFLVLIAMGPGRFSVDGRRGGGGE